MVPTDDQVRPQKLSAEFFHFIFGIDFISPPGCAISHAHGDPHLVLVSKSPDVAEAALGFQVKIDDVFSGHAFL
jgi:hypothetical protein